MINRQYRYIKAVIAVVFSTLVIAGLSGCEKNPLKQTIQVKNTDFAMGTAFNSTLYGTDETALNDTLTEISNCLAQTDARISWRIEDSLTDQFNKVHKADVGADEAVFQEALEVAEKSQGAFDPTVLSVSKLWDIGGENQRHPSDEEIKEALTRVNYQDIVLKDGILSSDRTDQLFELGAIGKGYSLEKVSELIDHDQVSGGIFDAGSSIFAFGVKPDGSKFRVALRDPRGEIDDRIGILTVSDTAISTSGDYEKYFEEDGVRYHHIIDARTGYPADSGLMQVTVISEDSTLCDALSTAGFILGLEDGMKLMNSYNVLAIFVDKDRNVYYNKEIVLDYLEFEGESEGYSLKYYEA